jgi:hypothetical protein
MRTKHKLQYEKHILRSGGLHKLAEIYDSS